MRSILILLAALAGLLTFVVAAQDEVPKVDRATIEARKAALAEAQAAWDKMPSPARAYFRSWRAAIEKETDLEKRAKLFEKYDPSIAASTLFALNVADGKAAGSVMGRLFKGLIVFQVIDGDDMLVSVGESERLIWISGVSTEGIEPDDPFDAMPLVTISTKKREYKNLRGGTQKVLHAEAFDPSPWFKFKDIWLR